MEVREIKVEQAHPVRQVVLRPGRPKAELFFPGDDVPGVVHLGFFNGEKLAGIATIFPEELPDGTPSPAWRLRGMAVLPEWQGKGVGRELLAACLDRVAEEGGACLWCNARHAAVPFYEKNGFTVVGEAFELPNIGEHYRMLCDFGKVNN